MDKIYDVIILGAGPAGLAAGLYAGRSRLSVLMLEKGQDGGQIAITDEIENYPGQMVEGESGPSLIARLSEQAKKFGAERCSDMIKSVELQGEIKKLVGVKGEYQAKTVILATGAFPKPIGCENEGKFTGKGISFCATCDAAFFEDFEVFVVGGGDSAVEEAMYLTKFARKVTIIHRRDELRAAKSIQEKAFANPKISFLWDSAIDEVVGDNKGLSGAVVRNLKTNDTKLVAATGLFHPYALGMASGVGAGIMMSSAVAALSEVLPEYASEIQAMASASETISGIDGIYMAIFIGLPMCNWLYKKLEPTLGRVTKAGRAAAENSVK